MRHWPPSLRENDAPERDDAVEWLRTMLSDGPAAASDLQSRPGPMGMRGPRSAGPRPPSASSPAKMGLGMRGRGYGSYHQTTTKVLTVPYTHLT